MIPFFTTRINQLLYVYLAYFIIAASTGYALPGKNRHEAGRLYLRNFDYKEYGGHQENGAVVQDSTGVMYFGNNWGVLEYDGVSWRLIRTEKETSVLSLDIDSTGTIYVGLENGFGYLAPDSLGLMNFVSLEDHLSPDEQQVHEVWKIHATSQGVYFLTIGKLYLLADDSLKVIPITVSALSTVLDDTLYYGEWKSGIMRVVEGEMQLLPGSERFARVQNFLVIPYPAEKTILLGTREDGLLVYRGGAFVPFRSEVEAYIKKNQLYCTLNLPANQLALGTIRGGVVIIDAQGRLLHQIDKAAGLRDQTIVSMLYDRHGGLWLAQLNGIARVEISTPLTRFDANMGVTSGINAIIRHKDILYAGTHRGVSALLTAPPKSNQSTADVAFEPVEGINSFAWTLYSDGSSLLAGTDKGIFEIKGTEARFIGGYPYRVRGFVRSKKHSRRLYAALQRGLGVLQKKRGTWTYVGKVQGPSNNEMMTIANDSADTIWLAEKAADLLRIENIYPLAEPDSLYKFGAEVSHFGKEHGLPEGQINVFTIRDRVLFSSEAGLFDFDEQGHALRSESTYGDIFTDPNCAISQMREDAQGAVWFFARLADRIMLGAAQPQAQDSFRWFGTPFRRITDIGEVKAIYPEENGVVWFGGTEAIMRYEPSLDKAVDIDFKTLIRRVSVKDSVIFAGATPPLIPPRGGKRRGVSPRLLDYAHNAMRFEFAAAFYDEAPANRYRYLLEGFDEDWSNWTAETKKDYTNLPEGRYRFRVQARNVYGHTGQQAIFAFKISPPWYRTWWAYLLYTLIFAMIMFGVSRTQIQRHQRKAEETLRREKEQANLREATLRAEAEKEREKEQMRTHIASDLHDEVGSNLSSIAMITQMLEKKTKIDQKDRQRLRSIHRVAQETAHAMRDIVWFVNPVNDSLDKLLVKMRETANLMLESVDFSFEAPKDSMSFETDLNFRRNLFLFYKEILQNIVKHAQASNIHIRVEVNEHGFLLKVCDNGVGFDLKSVSEGNGLRNFQQRADDMLGKVCIESAPGRGTKVEFRTSP